MNKLDEVASQVDTRDHVLLILVENIRESGKLATPGRIASQIKGAPRREVARVLERLCYLGVLDRADGYRITNLGAGVMERDVTNWNPGTLEQERRDAELAAAVNGSRGH